jgi:CHAT domain-containing protein/Tfp pilus assembly protein PilF
MKPRQLIIGLLGFLILLAPVFGEQQVSHPELEAAEAVYRKDGPAEALPIFEALLQKFEQDEDARNVAITEGYLGALHWRLGNFEIARQHLDTALMLKREAGLRLEVGKTLNVMGLLEWDLGNFEAAISQFSSASEIGREVGDARLEGATLNNISLVYDELGDYDTSLSQYERALAIYETVDFARGISDTLGNIGGLHLLLGHFSEAANYYNRALTVSTELESIPAMSQDHGNLGLSYTGMGRTELAIGHFEKALILAEQAGMRQEQGVWHRGLANAHIQAGRLDLGLRHHGSALEIYDETGAKALLIDALHDMGLLHLQLGDPISADGYFHRAMDLAVETGLTRAVTSNQIALGDIQRRHQQFEAATALYIQALGRAKESGEKGLQTTALLRLSEIYLDHEHFEDALTAANEALSISKDTQAKSEEALAIYLRAEVARLTGDIENALQGYGQALELSDQILDPEVAWKIEYGRGLALAASSQKKAAIEALISAVSHIESVRSRLQEKRFQAGYIQDKHQVYIELARLQLEIGDSFEAFETAERLRNWSYDRQTGDSARSTGDRIENLAEIELRERIRQLQRSLESETMRSPPDQRQLAIDTFSRELLLAEQEYQALLDDESSASNRISGADLRKSELHKALLANEALVEYLVGEDHILVFVVTSQSLWAHNIPATRNDLRSRLELLRDLIGQHENQLWALPAASLSETLLLPLMERGWLDEITHLYLVPHDMLNYLPFALLPVNSAGSDESMIDRYTLAYLPTASALTSNNDREINNLNLLAMAPSRSRLAHALEEATSIARLFHPNAEAVLGKAATESWFKGNARNYRVLHLATHGYFNKLNPLLSGLQLESDLDNDGLLEVHEILDLRLNSELVTLSACETGLGSGFFAEIPAGDDFVSMTRAFLQVGSGAVLATLWEVDDRSTVDLMKGFYRSMETTGSRQGKAVALTLAQKQLKSSQAYRHPYYWAPFVLMGSAHQSHITRS